MFLFVLFFAWHQWVQWWSEFQGTLLSFKWAPWRQQHATLWRFTLWGTWLRVQPRQLNSLRVSVPGSSVFSFRNCSFKIHTKAFWGNNTYIHFYVCIFICAYMKHAWNPRREGINNVSSVFLLDVDAPYDLAASNILIESGLLAWKPPRADITGYILSFESTDGTVRVSIRRNLVESGLAARGISCLVVPSESSFPMISLPGGGAESIRRLLQHGSTQCLHGIFGETSGYCRSEEKQSHHNCVHDRWVDSILLQGWDDKPVLIFLLDLDFLYWSLKKTNTAVILSKMKHWCPAPEYSNLL